MVLQSLELEHYRSYTHCQLTFDKNMHIFVGKNGVGKTNLVEAIHYLSLARSFRTKDDQHLVQKGANIAKIKAAIQEDGRTRKVEIIISESGKKVLINFKPIQKLSQLSELIHVLVFEPSDVLLFEGMPRARRQFLDVTLSKFSPLYLKAIGTYEKLLKERNFILKQGQPDVQHLQVITEQMIESSFYLVEARKKFLLHINDVISKITSSIKGSEFNLSFHYVPFVEPNGKFIENARRVYAKSLANDLKYKMTHFGVHREDFVVVYQNEAIAHFGSQGENRLAAIALKLSPYFLVENIDKKPVIVLDDVLSELDEVTQVRLLKFLEKMQQVFITTTHLPTNIGVIYDIHQNEIHRRI